MKILLITPRNPTSFWTFDAILPILDKQCIFPNLSMPTLAGLTPAEHEIELCDENVEDIDFGADADIIGITGYIVHAPRMREIAAEFQRRGRFVVIGGPYASLCPDEVRGFCDVLFVDEAEETWSGFLDDFTQGSWKTEYRPAEKPDLTHAPMPRFDLLDFDRYHAITIQFARGCPFNCEFCDIIVVYGRRPRVKTTEQMMREARASSNREFVIGTETGVLHRLRRENPGKRFLPMARDAECRYMKQITLENLRDGLRDMQYEVVVPPATADRARLAIERMLAIG